MNALHTRAVSSTAGLSRKLLKLERCGRYRDALELLSMNGAPAETMPDVSGLAPGDAAYLQLRYGVLVGFYGHRCSVSGAQGRSKDIITNALTTFTELGDLERVAECENFIALAYWRTGEHREAETWVEHALGRELSPVSDVRLYSHVVKSLVLMDTGRHEENVAYCRSVEEIVRLHGDAFLSGCIFANMGVSLKDLGHRSDAVTYLDLGKAFHERARHRPYVGAANNNLALLYKDLGRFHMAHFSVDKAISIYKRIGDRAREGSSLETKAQVYVAEGNLGLAMTTIDRSIAILKKSENLRYLAESVMSRAKIFLAQDNFADAILNLIEAVEITRNSTGETAARQLIDEFETALNGNNERPPARREEQPPGAVEMVLPPEIAHYQDYKGVWIHNSHLETIGVSQGSLALVVKGPVGRGDAAAVLHTESGEVSCGLFDSDFGIVALEGSGEPQLFDLDKVEVLGKVVGVCDTSDNADGKLAVRPIAY